MPTATTVTATDNLHSLSSTVALRGNVTPAAASPSGYGSGFSAAAAVPVLNVAGGLDSVYRVTAVDVTVGDEGVSHMALTLSIPPPSKPGVPSNLYFMQALVNLQNQVSALSTAMAGAGGKTYATVVVAAHNSRSINADFVCAGFTDEQTINLAILALPADPHGIPTAQIRGKVLLLEGTYNTAAPIAVPPTGIIVEGLNASSEAGVATLIQGAQTNTALDDYELLTVAPFSTFAAGDGVEIHHISFFSRANSQRAGRDLGVIGVHDLQNSSVSIHDCVFSTTNTGGDPTTGAYSILIGQDPSVGGANPGLLGDAFLYHNWFDGSSGIRTWQMQGAIQDNFFNGPSSGIECLYSNSNLTISGNYFDGGCSGGPNVLPAIYVEREAGNIVVSDNILNGISGPGVVLDSCFEATVTGNVILAGGGLGDDSPTAFPLRGDPSTKVGCHAVAIRYTFTGTMNFRGPVTVADNDTSNSLSMVSVIAGTKTTTDAQPLVGLNIHGNTGWATGASGIQKVAAIQLDGGLAGIVSASVVGNVIIAPSGAPGTLVDGIRLQNKVTNSLVASNNLGTFYPGRTPTWGPLATGPYPINIATPDCSRNFVTGNYCAPGYINDAGTNDVVSGNYVSPNYTLDGAGGVWTPGTGLSSGVQVGGGNTAEGASALAEGYGADAYEQGQVAHASTRISHAGDAQASEVTAAAVTFDATPTALANQSGSRLVAFPDGNRTVEFEIVVVARTTP